MTGHFAGIGRRALLLALFPAAAHAHDGLQRSVPAKDAHLAVAPTSLRLTFTNAPQLAFVRVQLLGPDSVMVLLGAPRLDSVRTVVLDITGPLRAGVHTVVWQIAGADGHPVRGRFNFILAPGATGLDAHAGHTGDTAIAPTPAAPHHDPTAMPSGEGFGAGSPAYVAIRWAALSALVALIGAVAFRVAVLPLAWRKGLRQRHPELPRDVVARAAMVGAAAGALLLVATVGRLVAQSYAMHGGAQVFDAGLVRGMITGTTWGRAWVGHVVAGVVALAGFLVARRAPRVGWTMAAIGAVGAALTSAMSGHAVAAPRASVIVVIDTLHALAASGWLGGLLALVVAGMPAALALAPDRRGHAVAGLVNAFSPMALAFAALAAVSGLALAWTHLGSLPAVWTSSYGRTLLFKLGVLAIVAATGAFNWLRVKPALASGTGAVRLLRGSASVELVVTIAVIAVTAVLVATPPPAEMAGPIR